MHAWLLGYDGWFGTPMASVIWESTCVGRGTQYTYLDSWHARFASNPAICIMASMRAESGSLNPCSAIARRATAFHAPALNDPPRPSQYCAMRTCSLVRVSEIKRTSRTFVRNSAASIGGGGAARKSPAV